MLNYNTCERVHSCYRAIINCFQRSSEPNVETPTADDTESDRGQSTRLTITDVTDDNTTSQDNTNPSAATAADTAAAAAGGDRPLNQGDVQSQKLLTELQDIADFGFCERGEINPSAVVADEVEQREKTREEKIMELAATVGTTSSEAAADVPYDEDLEGLD